MKIIKRISMALLCLVIMATSNCFAMEKLNTERIKTNTLNTVISTEFKEMGDYKEGLYTGLIATYENQDIEIRIMNDTIINNIDITNLKIGDRLSVLYTEEFIGEEVMVPSIIIPKAIALNTDGGYLTTIEDVEFNDDSIVVTLPDTTKMILNNEDIAYGWNDELEATANTLTANSIIYVHDNKIDMLNIAGLSEKLLVGESGTYVSYNTPGNEMNTIRNLGSIIKIETEDYVSLRKIFENMGPNYRVYWSPEEGVVLLHNNTKYYITNGEAGVGSSKLKVVYSYDDLCAIIRNGTTYIPLSWVSSIFGVGSENVVLPSIRGTKIIA